MLDVWLARNFISLSGMENLPSLQFLGVHDCPSLETLDLSKFSIGPKEIVVGGCARLSSVVAGIGIKGIEKIKILGHGEVVKISRSIAKNRVNVEILGRDFVWVD